MGLGNMKKELEHMLDDLQEEVSEEKEREEPKKEEKVNHNIHANVDDLLKDLPDMMIREKRKKEIGIQPTWEMPSKKQVEEPKKELPPMKMKPKEKGGRAHILIVDDDIRMLKMIKEILKDCYDTAVASNGDIALKFLERHETDLILLDYIMPGKSGKDVLKEIRETPSLANIPVFFLTGVSDAEKVKECLVLRPQGYMLKPVQKEELLKKLKEILG